MRPPWSLSSRRTLRPRLPPVMTRADRLSSRLDLDGRSAAMIRSDYRPARRAMSDLPGPLRLTSTFPFVGRSAELETLRALMPLAEGEGRRVVLLGGEPGSGKSRLVREFAAEAAGDGALVLYGACDAVVRTPYGPFVEALDQLARVVDPAELRAALGAAAASSRACSPTCRPGSATCRRRSRPTRTPSATGCTRRSPTCSPGLSAPAGAARARGRPLGRRPDAPAPAPPRARRRQRARAPARHLPRHRGRRAGDALARRSPTCAAPTTSSGCGSPASPTRRSTEFVRHAAGGDAGAGPPELARAIGELTDGNAFLVCELWRALVETGIVEVVDGDDPADPAAGRARHARERARGRQPAALAPGAGDDRPARAGGHRRRRSSSSTSSAAPPGLSEPELLAALDEAVRSGMIEELPSRRLAYRFTHELVRRALYDRLSGVRRAELHLRVGEALERAEGRSGRALADLAHHFAAAAPLGGAAARRRVQRAAPRGRPPPRSPSTRRRRGCAPRSSCGSRAPRERAEVLLELGTASHRAGKALDALEAFRAAADIARELDDAELLARAAIGYEDACWRPGIADQGAVELLEEAADGARRRGAPSCASGCSAGSPARSTSRATTSAAAIVRTSAIAMARAAATTAPAWPRALMRSYWSRGHELARGDPRDADRGRGDLGEELGNTEIRAEAMAWRVPTFVALGDLDVRAARGRRAAARPPSRRRSRSCSTSPSTTARRSRCATGASRRPRRGRSARTSGAGC